MNDNDYDNYIECSECGHPLERHIGGCDADGCSCAGWTRAEVTDMRRKVGLSGRWIEGSI